MQTVFNSLPPVYMAERCENRDGKKTFIIRKNNEYASTTDVKRLLFACIRHLTDIDQADIDASNEAIRENERKWYELNHGTNLEKKGARE